MKSILEKLVGGGSRWEQHVEIIGLDPYGIPNNF
jgi:hypothetical protein